MNYVGWSPWKQFHLYMKAVLISLIVQGASFPFLFPFLKRNGDKMIINSWFGSISFWSAKKSCNMGVIFVEYFFHACNQCFLVSKNCIIWQCQHNVFVHWSIPSTDARLKHCAQLSITEISKCQQKCIQNLCLLIKLSDVRETMWHSQLTVICCDLLCSLLSPLYE